MSLLYVIYIAEGKKKPPKQTRKKITGPDGSADLGKGLREGSLCSDDEMSGSTDVSEVCLFPKSCLKGRCDSNVQGKQCLIHSWDVNAVRGHENVWQHCTATPLHFHAPLWTCFDLDSENPTVAQQRHRVEKLRPTSEKSTLAEDNMVESPNCCDSVQLQSIHHSTRTSIF